MATLVELCKSSTIEEIPFEMFENIVLDPEQCNFIDIKNKQEYQLIISCITRFLSRGVTRARGLTLLKALCLADALKHDAVVQHGHVWLPLCVNSLKLSLIPDQEKVLAFYVINELIKHLSKVHELDRSTISGALSDLIGNIEKVQPNLHLSALICIRTFLERFSKAAGSYKTQIEKFLIQFLDSTNMVIVVNAARCAHLLQQVRGGGEHGVNHKLAWKNQFSLYISCANTLVEEICSISNDKQSYEMISFFANSTETQVIPNVKESCLSAFNLAKKNICETSLNKNTDDRYSELSASNKTTLKILLLFTRLKNILVFIQAMLVDPYPVPKCIKCSAILDILLQCLSLKLRIPESTNTPELTTVISQVPSLQIVVLKTIEAFAISTKGDVIPYASLLMKILLQVLESTKREDNFINNKPFRNIRSSTYSALCTLFISISTFKPTVHENNQGFEDKLISNIMDDIIYQKPSMQLAVKVTGSLKNMSKRARNKLTMSQLLASNLTQSTNEKNNSSKIYSETTTQNVILTKSALKCLGLFFETSGMFLKQNTHRIVQEALIKQIYEQMISKATKEEYYKTLLIVESFRSCQQSSIIPYCLNVFSNQHDSNLKLKKLSRESLQHCMNFMRGSVPTLQFPPRFTKNLRNGGLLTYSKSIEIENILPHEEIIDVEKEIRDLNKKIEMPLVKRKENEDIRKSPSKKSKIKEVELEILESSDDDCTIMEIQSEPSRDECSKPEKNETRESELLVDNSTKIVEDSINLNSIDEIRVSNETVETTQIEPETENKIETRSSDHVKITSEHEEPSVILEEVSKTVINIDNTKITIEEMMSCFVDEVNEDV